ncbi:unnamed protein product [Rotaria magnacalcarata]|uniref:Uncharacterized protein n=1 Tax=Rotaria magnacalcarata TaxID=392030 RepID=A0A8S2W1Y5_9BILA|nr:unnamed protein product [Rotaria magnacalcarata]
MADLPITVFFSSESCLQHFAKLAHGTLALGNQICFWWSIWSQIRPRQIQYSPTLFLNAQLVDNSFLDYTIVQSYDQEFALTYNQMFGKFPDVSIKYYCRYQRGLLLYHSLIYNRGEKSASYNVCVKVDNDGARSMFSYGQIFISNIYREMFNHGAGITPGHTRQFTTTTSNSLMTFDDDLDESNLENNEFDENNPWIRDVPLFSQPHRQSSVRRTNQNKNKGSYDTPQVKRRRIQDQVESISQDTLNESFNLIQSMLQDMNRKIDLLAQRVDDFGKKIDIVDKRLGGLAHRVNKNPTPGEIPNNLPVIK